MTLRKPNLFIIGAHKSGSAALRGQLMVHPQVFMCTPKEPSYFVTRETLRLVYPAMEEKGFWQSEEHYLRLFEAARECSVVGEASVNYSRRNRVTGVAERIYGFNPDARFIYIMRDPIERTISHYWYMVNLYGETRAIERAIKEDPDYLDTSHYAFQLAPYIKLFGMDRIFTLTTEAFRANPTGMIGEICDWLDLDKPLWRPPPRKIFNPTPEEVRQVRSWATFHGLRQSFLWNKLRPFIPDLVQQPIRRVTESRVSRQSVATGPAIAYLKPIQSRQTDTLGKLLGRDFPERKTLYGITP